MLSVELKFRRTDARKIGYIEIRKMASPSEAAQEASRDFYRVGHNFTRP